MTEWTVDENGIVDAGLRRRGRVTPDFRIAWILTGDIRIAGSIMSIEIVTEMFLYYAHERIWNRFM